MLKRIASILGLALLAAAALSSPVQAEGGSSIASAPAVRFGQLETGDTANGLPTDSQVLSLWKLNVKAGDTVTIDWKAARGTNVEVFPQGTSDYTLAKATPLHRSGIGSTGKSQFKFVASKAGVMPLAFECLTVYGAPYSFTARVRHWNPR